MRLLRVGAPGEERPAVRTEEGRLLDLSSVTSDIDGAFLPSDGVDRAREAVAARALPDLNADGVRIGAPVARPGNVALGLPETPYLRPGETVELSVDGLGAQRQTFGQT